MFHKLYRLLTGQRREPVHQTFHGFSDVAVGKIWMDIEEDEDTPYGFFEILDLVCRQAVQTWSKDQKDDSVVVSRVLAAVAVELAGTP